MSLDMVILPVILMVLMVNVDAQNWPLSGSCMPCRCSLIDNRNERIRHVNCFNLNLTEIPSNLPVELEILDFSNNKLQSTNVHGVRKFTSLQILSLVNNNITTLDDSPFSESSSLTHINFTGNSITKLTEKAFVGLEQLKALYGLKVESADTQVFSQLLQLGQLDIEITSSEIPEKIFDGLVVQSLNLTLSRALGLPDNLFAFGGNTLKHLRIVGRNVKWLHEDMLIGLTFLKSICLELPLLKIIPERIFIKHQLRNLQNIELITTSVIPLGIFSDLDNLLSLVIETNEELPRGLFDSLVNLQVLNLSNSIISQIPINWFSQLSNLLSLSISQTTLRRLDSESLIGLVQLKKLDLSGNSLRLIPKDVLAPFQNTLETLDLSENILKNIETNALGGMLSLKRLDLSDNKMSSLQVDMFNDLKRLSILNMQENMLYFLPNDIFHNQQRLTKLNLASNSFRKFPHALLEVSGLLINLDLSNNYIRDISHCLDYKFPFLEYLSLDSNPLHCNCNILRLKESHTKLQLEGKCDSPKQFANIIVSNISMPDRCQHTTCDVQSTTVVLAADYGRTYEINPASVIYTEPYHMASAHPSHDVDLDVSFTTATQDVIHLASPVVMMSAYHNDKYPPLMSRLNDGNYTYIYIPRNDKDKNALIIFDRIEMKAAVGGLGGFIVVSLLITVVYLKKKHNQKTRYVVEQLKQKNYVI